MGSGASKKKAAPKIVVAAASDDAGDDVDPTKFISPEQSIVHSGLVWKLNLGADPKKSNEWLRRKMWLTDSGGLFYFSRQFGRPVGRPIASLTVLVRDSPMEGKFAFEIHTQEDQLLAVDPTVLAADTEGARDAWVRHLKTVCERAERKGTTGHVDPLEVIAGLARTDRRRMSKRPTNDQTPQLSVSSPPNDSPPQSSLSFGKTLRSSLNDSFLQHSQSLSVGHLQGVQDLHHTPSCGPSAFLERPTLPKKEAPRSQLQVRRDSQLGFAERHNTMLVLDWDDTLFPTTFVRQDCGLDWRHPITKQVKPGPGRDELIESLGKLAEKVEEFLNLACSLANVVVVTLAKRPWVETSADNFMPSLRTLLERHGIEVVYAREKITEEMKQEYSQNAFKSSQQEADFWMQAKAAAMLEQIRKLYSSENNGGSWKNILSFGDSDFERVALVTTAEGWVLREKEGATVVETGLTTELITKDGHRKRLRTKTVKMLDEPALEEMIAQITLLHSWLPHLIMRDSGIDVLIEDSDDDAKLNELDLHVTGRSQEMLTWRRLAGLEE